MQNTRYAQHKLRNFDIELRAVVGTHQVTAAHRANLRGKHRAAGVFKTLVRLEQGLLAYYPMPAYFLDMVVGVGDDQVAADKFGCGAAEIGDVDGVGKYEAIARFIRLAGQVTYLRLYDETVLIIFSHAWHLNRFHLGPQDGIWESQFTCAG